MARSDPSLILEGLGSLNAHPEALFRALDGQDVEVDGEPSHVEVCGVYDDGAHRWVQLWTDGPHERLLTFRLDAGQSGAAVVSQVAA